MYTKKDIFKAVSTVMDPEVGFNLVEMGLIYDASCTEEGDVNVIMTLSTKACPLHQMIVTWVEEAVIRELPMSMNATVEVVWEPIWNISMANQNVQTVLQQM